MIITTLPGDWASLLDQLNITEVKENDKKQQEQITSWCTQFIKSDFQFVSFAATRHLVEECMLLNKYGSLEDIVDDKSRRTVLHKAASLGYDRFLDATLNNHVDIDITDENKNTALHLAADKFRLPTVKCLIEHKSNPNCINRSGHLPLNLVARSPLDDTSKANEAIFKYLLPITDPELLDFIDTDKRTLILDLVALKNPDYIKMILAKRPDLELAKMLDPQGQNILHLAIIQGANDIVKAFMEDKSLLLQKTSNGSTVLHLAALHNRGIISMLIEELGSLGKKMIDSQDNERNNLLHHLTLKEPPDETMASDIAHRFDVDTELPNIYGEVPKIENRPSLTH
ncbi:ankyrin repeat protein [Legionella busanensis]|uniref:Ankyrin repeat protein n=1 Tax=Legionella busanensis TaxID=190655 RepID=A0A378JNN9_9GAMM|nr:ankyrin repeat domain-containing protein [Legionella busanensis]STX52874.1 ankyrin repeat protein [Legionella busanensis]